LEVAVPPKHGCVVFLCTNGENISLVAHTAPSRTPWDSLAAAV
jgi:hypothetical protein